MNNTGKHRCLFTIGDATDSGHGVSQLFELTSNVSLEKLSDLYREACINANIDLLDVVCAEERGGYLTVETLLELGLLEGDIGKYTEEDAPDENLVHDPDDPLREYRAYPEGLMRLFIDFMMAHLEPRLLVINYKLYDGRFSLNTYLGMYGYGVFDS